MILQEVFDLFDKDGDGSIPTQEIGTAMRALGYYPREAEMVLMEDVAEEINFDQFLQLIKRYLFGRPLNSNYKSEVMRHFSFGQNQNIIKTNLHIS